MLLLSRQDVEELLDLDALVEALARAMTEVSRGTGSAPPRIAASIREQNAVLAAMPIFSPSFGLLSTKLVSVFPRNAGGPYPTHQGLIAVFDAEDGHPVAVMDATYITAARTAAGSALATKLLAREDASILAILGTGVQARSHARAIPRIREIKEVRVAGRDHAKADALAKEIERESGVRAYPVHAWPEATLGSDIVCATTHPHQPVVRWEWLSPGTHINSVGFASDGNEVDEATVVNSNVFVEQRAVAAAPMPVGNNDLQFPLRKGLVDAASFTEIGEVLSGMKPGRKSRVAVTLYKSVGVAAQDVAAASLVLAAARTRGVGTEVCI